MRLKKNLADMSARHIYDFYARVRISNNSLFVHTAEVGTSFYKKARGEIQLFVFKIKKGGCENRDNREK